MPKRTGKGEDIEMEDLLKNNDLFVRLHNGEKVICPTCGKGTIQPMSDMPIDQEFCFE